jgi:hypothetical protein
MNQVTELLSMAGVKKNANIIADAAKEFYAFVSKSFRKNGGLRPPRNDGDTKVDISKTFAQFNLVTIIISSKFEKNYMEGLLRPICGSWASGLSVIPKHVGNCNERGRPDCAIQGLLTYAKHSRHAQGQTRPKQAEYFFVHLASCSLTCQTGESLQLSHPTWHSGTHPPLCGGS